MKLLTRFQLKLFQFATLAKKQIKVKHKSKNLKKLLA